MALTAKQRRAFGLKEDPFVKALREGKKSVRAEGAVSKRAPKPAPTIKGAKPAAKLPTPVPTVTRPKGPLTPKQQKEYERKVALKHEREGAQIIERGGRKAITPDEMEAIRRRIEEAETYLAEEGAFEEVTPREIPLGVEGQVDVPVLGPTGGGLVGGILENAYLNGWIDRQFPESLAGKEAFPIPITPETLREASLREIRQSSFEKGVSARETFGSFIEAIPGVGKAASAWASSLETPSSNAREVENHINKIKEAASTGQEKVRNGLEDPEYGLDRARSMEEELAKLEGRLKLLISTSAILQANTDEVNKLQEQVLEAKEKVARYRQASSFGLTADLTGTGRQIPTDEQMFFELKELKGGE